MGTATLKIDLDAVATNWRQLDAMSQSGVITGAVVKAGGYGLGGDRVAKALATAGARLFFVAIAEEGAEIRQALGPGVDICVFSGHMRGDTEMISDLNLTPMLNSLDQVTRHLEALPGHPFGIQLDSGMNRLGMEPGEWAALRDIVLGLGPRLIMSHLACADEPDNPMNADQLSQFKAMCDGFGAPRSLAATGGILLGKDYHFEVTRPGIGLFGGQPFEKARAAVQLDLPIIQTRDVAPGETVGYGMTWQARTPARIATVSAGYADGIHRALSNNNMVLFSGKTACPVVGRISMDTLSVDVTHVTDPTDSLSLFGPHQSVDDVAKLAGTIGYEILTSLGDRYTRRYVRGIG